MRTDFIGRTSSVQKNKLRKIAFYAKYGLGPTKKQQSND